MAKIKDRVVEYLKINGITKQEFCEKTGISYANMTGKSLQSELGGEQIYEILQIFPSLNPDWLLLGKGEMLRNNEQVSNAGTNQFEKNIDTLYYLIDLQKEKIAQLEKELCIEREKVASLSNATNTEHILL